MKIKVFIEKEKECESSLVDLARIKKYIPSAEKVRIAKEVMDSSIDYDRGFIKFDSYMKYLNFVFCIIEAHTDLRFADNWDDKMQEYDALCESGLLDDIIGTFRTDYDRSLMVLDMMCNDALSENSIEASIVKLTQSASENLDVFVGALADKLEGLDIEKIIPKDLDLNKLQRLLNKLK